MAGIPAPHLFGAQRVVISCHFDASLAQAERDTVCEQLVTKAQRVTSLPVAAASPGDLAAKDLARLSEQLLLRVDVSGATVDSGRKALTIRVTPVRPARRHAKSRSLTSKASLVRVADSWVIQGPVDAFDKILAGTPRRLSRPVRSD